MSGLSPRLVPFGIAEWLFLCALFIPPLYMAVLLLVGSVVRPGNPVVGRPHHRITVVIPVRNGEDVIRSKIANVYDSDYPMDLVSVIVVSDGSTDRTVERASTPRDGRVKVVTLSKHRGKGHAINAALSSAQGCDLVLFTDADTLLDRDCLRALVSVFDDPRVGCATGAISYTNGGEPYAAAHQRYFSVESRVRLGETLLGIMDNTSGAICLMRRDAIDELPSGVSDDLFFALSAAAKGFATVFVPAARVRTDTAASMASAFQRRRRIAAQGVRTGLLMMPRLLCSRARSQVVVSLLCHHLLRWFSPAIFVCYLLVRVFRGSWLELGVSALGCLVALVLPDRGIVARPITMLRYLLASFSGMLAGTIDAFSGRAPSKW